MAPHCLMQLSVVMELRFSAVPDKDPRNQSLWKKRPLVGTECPKQSINGEHR